MTSTSSMQCFTDCLDESNMEDPEIHIGSVGDLLKVIFERIFKKSFVYFSSESKKKPRNDSVRLTWPLLELWELLPRPPRFREVSEGQIRLQKWSRLKFKKRKKTIKVTFNLKKLDYDFIENRVSTYDNMAETSIGMKRDSPVPKTESKRQKTYHTRGECWFKVRIITALEIKTSDLSPTVLVKMRGPKPAIKPKPSFSGIILMFSSQFHDFRLENFAKITPKLAPGSPEAKLIDKNGTTGSNGH